MTRPRRAASPERWQAALRRGLAAGVQVRQLAGSGAWIATSASDPTKAYAVGVFNGIPRTCECAAAEWGDPVCVHRAMWFHAQGLLDEDDGAGADRRGMTLIEREAMAAAARERMTPAYAAEREAERERVNAARLARMAAAGSTVRLVA